MGTRMYSIAALLERIVEAFRDETDARDLTTSAERLTAIRDTTEYVLAVESVRLSQDEKADLLRRAYSALFGYGPLDALFLDERVTTIALNGSEKAAVRYGH